jgi:hypothetical protein
MTVPSLSLTEDDALTALRNFLLSVVSPDVEVILGQVNRVAEPQGDDFIVYWPNIQGRLSTNIVNTYDNILVASIAGAVLDVTQLVRSASPLAAGMLLIDGTVGQIAANTILGAQISGSVGGTGLYSVSPVQSLGSETLYAGQSANLVPIELEVQIDVHGPNSGNNVTVIAGLLRSEYGVDSFQGTGFDVTPLYSTDPRQAPFRNDQDQIEFRWSLDAHLQINPVIGVPIQFADELAVTTVEADTPSLV